MKLNFKAIDLQLKYPFTIANFSRTSTPVILTQIEHEGIIGYGEASMPPYLGESHQTAISFLSKINLTSFKPENTEEILKYVDELVPGNPSVKAAIDIALHDLLGKLQNKPCYEFFGSQPILMPATSITIGIDTPDVIREKVKGTSGFKFLKVKLGKGNDKEMIETIRSVTDKPLYVDANQGWIDKNQALEMTHWLADRGVIFVEQGMPKQMVDENAWLTEHSPIPTFGDEAVQRFNDVERAKGVYSGINIKLMKCTGMHEASKMIKKARNLNLKIMIGCMSETSCAILAAAALAPLCDYADLDGPWMTINKPFADPELVDGKIILSKKPGLGLTFN
ncbi:dipeptide epimerase [Solitalea koreensis]|uniref:Dipeptide epimerase n=1 Tax=Solitalea koreensis TaxID=543615 RepID=A0A521C927_9SPHI|nr:dipeptide epimerase [Solitalea koreensis]SMO55898.1 L-alanine-DL-glutamate epimerase [Solitalea koreensis]